MSTITYDFSVDILEGPLDGETFTGFFSYDDESEPVGFGYGSEEFFLTDFDFDFNGVEYTLDDVNCSFCPYDYENGEFTTTEPFWVGGVFPQWGSDSLSVRTPGQEGFLFGSSIFSEGQPEFEYGNVGSGVGVYEGDVTYTLRVPINTILGTPGKDILIGTEGKDIINGGDGKDTLVGGLGDDTLNGGDGKDVLTGVDPNTTLGVGEMDELTGGNSGDTFVLGDAANVYYDDGAAAKSGLEDYALITDFKTKQDVIQLHGMAADYILGASPVASSADTAIFLKSSDQNELIGVVEGVSSLALNSSYFSFV